MISQLLLFFYSLIHFFSLVYLTKSAIYGTQPQPVYQTTSRLKALQRRILALAFIRRSVLFKSHCTLVFFCSWLYKGSKEFFNYLSNSEPSQSGFSQAVDRMKLSTRQYAKRQISWIRNKLIPASESANREDMSTPFYLFDATGCYYPFSISLPIKFPAEMDEQCSRIRH